MRPDHLLVMRVPLAPQAPASGAPDAGANPTCTWIAGCDRLAVEADLCESHFERTADLRAEARERWARYDERYGS